MESDHHFILIIMLVLESITKLFSLENHPKVIDATKTEITFDIAPEFDAGDVITLDENVICDPTSAVCTPEKLSQLRGIFDYNDALTNSAAASDTFLVGHEVTLVPNSEGLKYTIPIGWPDECPPADSCGAGVNGESATIRGFTGRWLRRGSY
jgi:hypothetical protein